MPTWDDQQYAKFLDARTRPAAELLARVPLTAAESVLDLGCGPGNSTALLRARWPNARVVGVDSSKEMLRSARATSSEIEWIEADIRDYRPESPVDVLFANAVMQWLPDHERLFPQLLERVRPGGALAIQMPYNFDEPSHRAMREVAGPWGETVAGLRHSSPVGTPAFYYDLFAERARGIDIWQTRYEQVMADAQAIVEWVKGTGLRPYLEAVSASERDAYLKAYETRIAEVYPTRVDGRRLFPFPRLFLVVLR